MDGRRSASATSSAAGVITASTNSSSSSSNNLETATGVSTRRHQRRGGGGGGNNTGEAILQHEIDHWIAAAGKKYSQMNKHQEAEAQNLLTNNSMDKLRELHKEIDATNWIFGT